MKRLIALIGLALAAPPLVAAPTATPWYQSDFTAADFTARHARIYDAIGKDGVALVQGMADSGDMSSFRQSNEFYYLTGVEVPHAYLLLDGRTREATIYLPPRDHDRERNEGASLAAEDEALVRRLTGASRVRPAAALAADLSSLALRLPGGRTLYTPMSPGEVVSRDTSLAARAARAADPWDGGDNREGRLVRLIGERFPQLRVADLSPTLDAMRLIKSDKEIALVRRATRIAGAAIIEAMRSTAPGVREDELGALARYIFFLNGARGEGYGAIIAGGSNAYIGHYWRKTDRLRAGDLLLFDYAPDYRFYTSDVARLWPVSGRFDPTQRHVGEFLAAYRDALVAEVRPGVTSDQVLDRAALVMKRWLEARPFADPGHARAAAEALKFQGHFQHSVGMAVHDVGRLRGVPLQPGMIFTIDPMMWLHDRKLYFRIEDMVLVTPTGHDNMSAFVPSAPDAIERLIAEPGALQSPDRARLTVAD